MTQASRCAFMSNFSPKVPRGLHIPATIHNSVNFLTSPKNGPLSFGALQIMYMKLC